MYAYMTSLLMLYYNYEFQQKLHIIQSVNKNNSGHSSSHNLISLHKNLSPPVLTPSTHSSGETKEHHESSVAGFQVHVSFQVLPHAEQEIHSLKSRRPVNTKI
jgi:hypothetical protein